VQRVQAQYYKLRFWTIAVILLTYVALRRLLVRGPRRPSWSMKMELALFFLRLSPRLIPLQSLPMARVRKILAPGTVLTSKNVEVQRGKIVGDIEGEWVQHIFSKENPTDTMILYLHGGGYCILSSVTHRSITFKLSKLLPAKVLAIDYRLAPEHPFPAGLEDVVAVYKWLISPDGGKVVATNIVIAGDSAGGGLTLATLLKLRDEGLPLPGAAVCLSPWVDLERSTDSWKRNRKFDYLELPSGLDFAKMYAASESLKNPLISPIHADLRGLPPLFIQVGEVEMLHDEAVILAERAQQAGVDVTLTVYQDMVHVFQAFPFAAKSKEAFQDIAKFVRAKTKSQDEVNHTIQGAKL